MAWSVEKKHGNLPRRRPEDPFERIWAHYHDLTIDVVLSDSEKERIKIYDFAYKQYLKGFSRGEVAKNLIVKFKEEEDKEIAHRTAFQYLRDSIDLFGDIEEIDLSREKRIFIERSKMALRKCEKAGQWSAWATINQTLAKIYDFNQTSDELTEYLKKFQAITIILSSDVKSLEQEAAGLVEDILFEEIQENGGDETP
jgi:hypothetical protein